MLIRAWTSLPSTFSDWLHSLSDDSPLIISSGLLHQIIRNEDLEELRELGSGTFGTVYHGKWRGTDVAIKRIKKSCFTGRSSEQERLVAIPYLHDSGNFSFFIRKLLLGNPLFYQGLFCPPLCHVSFSVVKKCGLPHGNNPLVCKSYYRFDMSYAQLQSFVLDHQFFEKL